MEEIVRALAPHTVHDYPPDLADWNGRGALVVAPWLDDADEDDEEEDDEDDHGAASEALVEDVAM